MQYYKLIVNDAQQIKNIKNDLEAQGKFNKTRKIEKIILNNTAKFVIYTFISLDDIIPYAVEYEPYDYVQLDKDLEAVTQEFFAFQGYNIDEKILKLLPKKWTIYPPMVLFSANTFDSFEWTQEFTKISKNEYFKYILETRFPNISHAAINKPIIKDSNCMRIPTNILPLYGEFGPSLTLNRLEQPTNQDFKDAFWCLTTQNGIHQTWAPIYTMFSRGNIKEKKRILDQFKQLQKTWVFDLYAGIGYFSLSYLKNGGRLVCFELNPWSVQALERNCQANGFTYQINQPIDITSDIQVYIFNESNEFVMERIGNIQIPISHVNLGLLPSSKQSWPITKSLVSHSTINTTVHVHENVHVDQIQEFNKSVLQYFSGSEICDTTKVKTFAPDVWHIVTDILIPTT